MKSNALSIKFVSYYHNCSEEYARSISPELPADIAWVASTLPRRETQAEMNRDLWWLFTSRGWCYDSKPAGITAAPPRELSIPDPDKGETKKSPGRNLCKSTTTLEAEWRTDFAKVFVGGLVHLEVQFGKVESMFKDFCGFRIGWYERRISLGIEIVVCRPRSFFRGRERTVSGMAYFEIARQTLPAIGLECPIWLVGLEE